MEKSWIISRIAQAVEEIQSGQGEEAVMTLVGTINDLLLGHEVVTGPVEEVADEMGNALFTVHEAAITLGITDRTVYNRVHRGELVSRKVNGKIYVKLPPREMEAY